MADETPEQSTLAALWAAVPGSPDFKPPILAAPEKKSTDQETLHKLKQFHLGGRMEAGDLGSVSDGLLPALLAPARGGWKLSGPFPLILYPPPQEGETYPHQASLSGFLKEAVEASAARENHASTFYDNLRRVEDLVRSGLENRVVPVDAAGLLREATVAPQEEPGGDATHRSPSATELEKLLAEIPAGSRFLGCGRHAPIHLFLHAVRHRLIPRRRAFVREVREVSKKILALLEVERQKSPAARAPETMAAAVGSAGSQYIDPVTLSQTLSRSGKAAGIPTGRRERMETALALLESFIRETEQPLVHIVHDGSLPASWLETEDDCELREAEDPCQVASRVYDEKAAVFAEVFRAIRIAQLELSGSYVPELHDPHFASFNWEAFSRPELLLLPVVVVVESADRVARASLASFSALLLSGRPVHVLAEVESGRNHGVKPGEDPLASYRLELGYVAISHREALVAQTSVARPEHLTQGFLQALEGTRTSTHLFTTGISGAETARRLSAWLEAEVALEGRAHPFFGYNPEAGTSWARRMDFSENPSPDADWPRYPLSYLDGGAGAERKTEVLSFTFADFALLDPGLRGHYRLVPAGFERDELVPVDLYLNLPPDQVQRHLPFIWVVDEKSGLQRAVVSRELLLACQDRLRFWRTLQELAGVHSEHATAAAEEARRRALQEAAAEREKLVSAHAQEIARVREATTAEVIKWVLEVLLSSDVARARQLLTAKTPAGAQPAAAGTGALAGTAAVVEEKVVSELPWIDSGLCTSCNDCMKINPVLFVYNENKQAIISDPKAGTFKQLVMAAEKCPARCIHPGKPLNPKEPGLDKLIERAKPYN